ncbi:MAG TPA: helicase-associated domain-containing protein [Microbacteriaceae bacterium]|nr:helicase-associated domain-containing protein [Microbacteriaceae bacterium]
MLQDTLALLNAVSQLDEISLAKLLENRLEAREILNIEILELVEKLLSASNIKEALKKLSYSQIGALRSKELIGSEQTLASLLSLGLLGIHNGSPCHLKAVKPQLDDSLETAKTDWRLPSFESSDDIHRTFTSTQKSVLLLREISRQPLSLNQSGSAPASVIQQLGERFNSSNEETSLLLDALLVAGFLIPKQKLSPASAKIELVPSANSDEWALSDHHARWLHFAQLIISNAPELISVQLSPDKNLISTFNSILDDHPLIDNQYREKLKNFVQMCELLGITNDGNFHPAIQLLLQEEPAKAFQAAAAHFPETVSGVIIQPDFSVIATGPLKPEQGLKLLELVHVVTPGLATTLQISPDSIKQAVANGWDPVEIGSFLRDISLTPLPQPLTFMLSELQTRQTESADFKTAQFQKTTDQPEQPQDKEVLKQSVSTSSIAESTARKILNTIKTKPHYSTLIVLEVAKRSKAKLYITLLIDDVAETLLVTPLSVSKDRFRALDQVRERELVIPLKAVTNIDLQDGPLDNKKLVGYNG